MYRKNFSRITLSVAALLIALAAFTQKDYNTVREMDARIKDSLPNTLTAYEKSLGWQLLFDGKTTDGWIGAYKKTFPEKGWQVKNGVLTVLGSEGKEAANGGDIVTVNEYTAFDLSFDFKLTPGANSGVKYFVTLGENNKGSAIGLEYQLLDDSLHPDAKLGRDGDRTLSSSMI